MLNHKKFLSKDQCKYFIGQAHLKGFEEGSIKLYREPTLKKVLPQIRKSLVSTLPTTQRVNSLIKPLLKEYGVKKLPEEFQIIKYRRGDYFKKHTDSGDGTNKRYKTLIIQLSESTEYKGADVNVYLDNIVSSLEKEQGSGILFNSDLVHEVTKLDDGVRYVLVMWFTYKHFDNKSVI